VVGTVNSMPPAASRAAALDAAAAAH